MAQQIRPEESIPALKLDHSEVRILHSLNLKDDLYLYICLPRTYYESNARFPVLYLTDADDFTMMTAEISRLMSVNNEIPEMIVVGLAYGAHITKQGNHRNRDYAPIPDSHFPESGSASIFVSCIEEEVFLEIDSKYRTNPSEKVFYGSSLGALFGTYVLFTRPEMFKRYILASPSLWWAEKEIFKDEEKYCRKSKSLPKYLYFSMGSEEDKNLMINPFLDLKAIIDERKYEGLHYKFQILEGETHLSAGPSGLIKGLREVYR